jgi:hypothetical protein
MQIPFTIHAQFSETKQSQLRSLSSSHSTRHPPTSITLRLLFILVSRLEVNMKTRWENIFLSTSSSHRAMARSLIEIERSLAAFCQLKRKTFIARSNRRRTFFSFKVFRSKFFAVRFSSSANRASVSKFTVKLTPHDTRLEFPSKLSFIFY